MILTESVIPFGRGESHVQASRQIQDRAICGGKHRAINSHSDMARL
jgi:hypothetical protein